MIGKEELKTLIQSYYKQDDRVNKLCEIFRDAFDNPILDWGIQMFEAVIEAYFNDKGCDWIFYYLYENPEKCYYDQNFTISYLKGGIYKIISREIDLKQNTMNCKMKDFS